MLESLLMIVAIVAITRIASADDRSPLAWGGVALGLCAVSLLIPLPFLRVLLAAGCTIVVMMLVKARSPS